MTIGISENDILSGTDFSVSLFYRMENPDLSPPSPIGVKIKFSLVSGGEDILDLDPIQFLFQVGLTKLIELESVSVRVNPIF